MAWRILLSLSLMFAVPIAGSPGDADMDGGLLGSIVTGAEDGRVDLEATYGESTRSRDVAKQVIALDIGVPDGGATGPVDEPAVPVPLRRDDCSPEVRVTCAGDPAVEPEPVVPGPVVVVTLRDIASFRPAKPGNGMEPGGWAIEDLAANFVAAASVEVVPGSLLGQPAEVRFTPVGYRWSHSDGGVVESRGPGASWAALGVREFSPTGTSHVYAESGEYTVALEVVLAAEYRFAGSGWRQIAGTLTVAGESQRVLVGEFDTVLTKGDCHAYPDGPGC